MTKTKEMGINHRTMKQKLAEYRHQPLSLLLLALTLLAAVITVGVLLCLIAYILYKGIPNMHLSLFAWKYTTENSSMMPAIINTLLMTVVTLMIAVPIGVFSAIYLVEYAKRGNKLVKVIRMRTTEEALLSVPDSFREGSFGLGAGRLRTIFRIILPSAMPGILAGIILAVGRIVGETAALMYTAGTATTVCTGPFRSCRTLAVHMYQLLCEGQYMGPAYATAVVLLVMVIVINALSGWIAKKLTK